MMQKTEKIIYRILTALFLLLFLPVLFSIIFIDKKLPYYENCRLATLLPNMVLFAVGLVCLFVIALWLGRENRKNRTRSRAWETAQKLLLPAVFVLLYFINVYIARETAYYTSWDPEVVRGYAYMMNGGIPLGYDLYLVINPNNITISYVLGILYKLAEGWKNYPYNSEFFWIQIGCGMVSVAGLAACLTVRRISKSNKTTWLSAAIYIVCIGLTPWKIVPYTDVYSMVFPVLSICFYVYYRTYEKMAAKGICLMLTFASIMLGGLMKPSVYVLLITILIAEVWSALFSGEKGRWKWLLADAVLLLAILFGGNAAKDTMVSDLGLIQNENIAATWHHYFYMGLNETTTGGYNPDDVAMYGEFQDRPIEERNKAEIERAIGRMQERGADGSLYFWLRKMVMTFNDGTLGWQTEGDNENAFAPIANGGKLTEFLRDVFWRNSRYAGRYNTICQFFWIMLLTCLPGICLGRRDGIKTGSLFMISFLGIFLYLMLFESRARYLFCFVPVLVVQAALGLENYSIILCEYRNRWRMKHHGRSKEDAPERVH